MIRVPMVLAVALALAGCNSSGPPAPSAPSPATYAGLAPGVAPPGFKLPEGAGCSGAVARFQAIMDNDLATGHVNRRVYDQIRGEIGQAASACQAGRDGEAQAMIRASRARHGYPRGD